MTDPIVDRYHDLLGDDPDEELVPLMRDLDTLLTEPAPPAWLSQRIHDLSRTHPTSVPNALATDLEWDAHDEPGGPIIGAPQPLRSRFRSWIHHLGGMAAAAVVLLLVGTVVAAILSNQGPEPSTGNAGRAPDRVNQLPARLGPPETVWDLNSVARTAYDAGLGTHLNLSQEHHGFTLTLRWAYADTERTFIYYTIEGPPDRVFNTISVESGLELTTANGQSLHHQGGGGAVPGSSGSIDVLGSFTAAPDVEPGTEVQLRFSTLGLMAVENLEMLAGTPVPYPDAVEGMPSVRHQGARREFPRLRENATHVHVYHYPGDPIQYVLVPGPFEFSFTAPVESETLPTFPTPDVPAPSVSPDAALATADQANEAAIEYAEAWLGAQGAAVTSTELMTLEAALETQQAYAGSRMPIWNPSSRGKPAWVVRITAERFVPPAWAHPCPSCEEASVALITLDASTGGIFWSAAGGEESGTQVFPLGPQGTQPERTDFEIDEAVMREAALNYLSQSGAIIGAEPEMLHARRYSLGDLRRNGRNFANYSPTCWRPTYVVILFGEIDVSRIQPGLPAAIEGDHEPIYLALLFDQTEGVPGIVTGHLSSVDRSDFAHLLDQGPVTEYRRSLEESAGDEYDYIPCEDMIVLDDGAP